MNERKYQILEEDTPPLLTANQVGELVGLSATTLRGYRMTGKGPRCFRAPDGARVLYKAADVDAWLFAAYEGQVGA